MQKKKKKVSSHSFKSHQQNVLINHIYLIYIYKQDLAFKYAMKRNQSYSLNKKENKILTNAK